MSATCNAAAPYAVEERLVVGDTAWIAIRAQLDGIGFGDTVRSALRDHCRAQEAEE